ncbi:unnamed protein product [Brugia pahangi]|uniref:Apple domain-containing protein n=1 Tax=Brugia pahangi TaxID=6280 RepID=A0A0N4T8F4_BRUPA|nr:unnamed protein product [Brugia pahangi]
MNDSTPNMYQKFDCTRALSRCEAYKIEKQQGTSFNLSFSVDLFQCRRSIRVGVKSATAHCYQRMSTAQQSLRVL